MRTRHRLGPIVLSSRVGRLGAAASVAAVLSVAGCDDKAASDSGGDGDKAAPAAKADEPADEPKEDADAKGGGDAKADAAAAKGVGWGMATKPDARSGFPMPTGHTKVEESVENDGTVTVYYYYDGADQVVLNQRFAQLVKELEAEHHWTILHPHLDRCGDKPDCSDKWTLQTWDDDELIVTTGSGLAIDETRVSVYFMPRPR